jgi:transglutaminase-like putative cysteine protease
MALSPRGAATRGRAAAIAGPGLALAGLGVAVMAAALATGDANIGSTRFPALLLAAVAIVGVTVSAARWQSGTTRQTPVNLTLTFGVAVLLLTTRSTLDKVDPHGGLHAMAEVFLVVLAIRSFALTDASRIRSALLLSLGAMLAASAFDTNGSTLGLLGLWVMAAVVALVATEELAGASTFRLGGAHQPRVAGPARTARRTAVVVALVALAALMVAVVNPDPGRGQPLPGNDAGGRTASPYVGFNGSLDTSVRGEPSDEVIMHVRANAPDFWRAESYDQWDGQVWSRSARMESTFPSAGAGYVTPGVGDVDIGGETFVQHVRVEAPYVGALFGAYRVDEIDAPVPFVIVHGDGSIELRSPLGRGAEYTVVSIRQHVTSDLLRSHDPLASPLPEFIAAPYLQLPSTVPSRVTDLAHSITDSAPTTYDKVRAIETWLGDNTTYTRDIPPLPEGADAVDQHLFVDRRGFCEQIATSTAVMLRSVGVPARVADGFVPGDESLLGGEFTVTAKDAHAWVEVWFPGVGWQAFDPTASVPLAGEYDTSALRRASDLIGRLGPLLIALGIVAVLGALVLFTVRAGRQAATRRRRSWVVAFIERLERAGARRGRPRAGPETPAEYSAALANTVLPDEQLAQVGSVVTRAAYSASEPDEDERRWADAVLDRLEEQFPVRRSRFRLPWRPSASSPAPGQSSRPPQRHHPPG